MPVALVTGITGMDGSHLADHLLGLGYEVHGVARRTSLPNTARIAHVLDRIVLHEGDVTDQGCITRIMCDVSPSEVYNLAAQSFVGTSWRQPAVTADVTGLGALRVFEAARHLQEQYGESPRVYQASTSEMFGEPASSPQNEDTPLHPRSPYGVAKLLAHQMARVYRESFDLYIACGILFNHEGPRRGPEFVTRKITRGVARISQGSSRPLKLGNLDAQRDWGYAPDFVEAMRLMLQQPEPDDYVVGTGTSRSVRDFLDEAFGAVGITDWRPHVEVDPTLFRPAEITTLRADPRKAKSVLGWEPRTPFRKWVSETVRRDVTLLKDDEI